MEMLSIKTIDEPPTDISSAVESVGSFSRVQSQLVIEYDYEASWQLRQNVWRLKEPLAFYVGERSENTWVYVHEGFLTDGATVPSWLRWLVPPWGDYGIAVVVHDYLCENLTLYVDGAIVPISRKIADTIFKDAMRVAKVGLIRRTLMGWGVDFYRQWSRVFGSGQNKDYIAAKRLLEKR